MLLLFMYMYTAIGRSAREVSRLDRGDKEAGLRLFHRIGRGTHQESSRTCKTHSTFSI